MHITQNQFYVNSGKSTPDELRVGLEENLGAKHPALSQKLITFQVDWREEGLITYPYLTDS